MQRLRAWGLRNECSPAPAHEIRPTTDLSLTALVKARVHRLRSNHPNKCQESSRCTEYASDSAHEHACFASQGPCGVLDLGASKTVIGSDCLPELIQSLDASTRQGLRRTSCNITFRFGNQATLTSQHAIVLPLGNLMWKIAVVPGGTPFLISNTLMRALKAQINCETRTLTSPMLHVPVGLTLTSRGLFLLDVNQLVKSANAMSGSGHSCSVPRPAETFLSDETEGKSLSEAKHVRFNVDNPKSHTQNNLNIPSPSITTEHGQSYVNLECHPQGSPCHEVEDQQEPRSPSNPAQIASEDSVQVIPNSCHGDVVTQRLRQLQIPSSVPVESLEHLTLSELATEVVSFGTKHQGRTFEEAWGDTEWVMFMLSRYQSSTKESHRRFIRFTELKIEAMEKDQGITHQGLPVMPNRGHQMAKAKAKPVAKSLATPSRTSLQDGEDDWDIGSEMYNPGIMNIPPMAMAEDLNALQQRMLHMENALTRVIAFIENQSMPNQEFHQHDVQ